MVAELCVFLLMMQLTLSMIDHDKDADRMVLGSVPVPEAAAAAFTQRVEDNHPSKLQNADVNVPARAHKAHCSRKRSQAASKVIEEYLMPFVEKEKFGMSRRCKLSKNDGNCLADACDVLHCHLVMNLRFRQRGCNPKAAAENRQLCESLADNCFPDNEGSSARRLHDLFLRQFCDAHTCSGGPKPLSICGKKRTSSKSLVMIFLLILSALIVCLVLTWQLRVTRHDQRKAELCRISLSKCTA